MIDKKIDLTMDGNHIDTRLKSRNLIQAMSGKLKQKSTRKKITQLGEVFRPCYK